MYSQIFVVTSVRGAGAALRLGDPRLAVRLADGAVAAGGDPTAGWALAEALVWAGDGHGAARVLASMPSHQPRRVAAAEAAIVQSVSISCSNM